MRTKRVNRYYCDHCGKGGCSAGHMRKHEQRCCASPTRVCGMCEVATGGRHQQRPIEELIAALREGDTAALREAAHGCPACMLAAIIQNGMRNDRASMHADGGQLGGDFNFKTERDLMWTSVNAEKSAT